MQSVTHGRDELELRADSEWVSLEEGEQSMAKRSFGILFLDAKEIFRSEEHFKMFMFSVDFQMFF